MARLYLVRHARPRVDPALPADRWELDPAGLPDLAALAVSERLPRRARWYSSPEPKALATARRLTTTPVRVAPDLVEHRREARWFDDRGDFHDAVRRAFARPGERSMPEWEPLADLEARLVPAVREILARHPVDDVVLVGHGTAWTVLRAALTGEPADLDAWAALRMPDVWEVPRG
ncbi:histidine phosphatase family protein [Nocardioides iriomotensis]|uniref:histidine phosphatase family protein n=1 Tax=Nocardioides iriomotensis TaxID=715784 RepID=UPI0013EDFAAD|nr:histidine phosphatase family protein [Nocardioides iriomotensis]